jgi:PilZ domain
MDRRDHHRVQLRLPARLRWTTPFGQKTEVCASVDVSRGGMLVPCREPHAEGTPLWVTFPFDASLTIGQPEVLARVVRAVVVVRGDVAEVAAKKKNGNGNGNGHGDGHGNGHHANGNGSNGHGANGNGHKNGNGNAHRHRDETGVFRSPSATEAAALESSQQVFDDHAEIEAGAVIGVYESELALATEFLTLVALRFELATTRQLASAHAIVPLRDVERRAAPRRAMVVPVRVRTEQMPWFEETMTIDCSADGLKFRSNREYTRGEFLIVSFEGAATSPWLGVTESLLMVVRIESEPDVAELEVAVCRTQQFAFRF